jgi:hypothetical protein
MPNGTAHRLVVYHKTSTTLGRHESVACICKRVPVELVFGVRPRLTGSERASLNCAPFPYLQTSADALITPNAWG